MQLKDILQNAITDAQQSQSIVEISTVEATNKFITTQLYFKISPSAVKIDCKAKLLSTNDKVTQAKQLRQIRNYVFQPILSSIDGLYSLAETADGIIESKLSPNTDLSTLYIVLNKMDQVGLLQLQ